MENQPMKQSLKSRWVFAPPTARLTQLFLINRINNHLQRYEKHSFAGSLLS